jgi:hypothetical protein
VLAVEHKVAADQHAAAAAVDDADAAERRLRSRSSAFTGGSDKSLARRNGRPCGSRKQSPVFRCTGSASPSIASQHSPETMA